MSPSRREFLKAAGAAAVVAAIPMAAAGSASWTIGKPKGRTVVIEYVRFANSREGIEAEIKAALDRGVFDRVEIRHCWFGDAPADCRAF